MSAPRTANEMVEESIRPALQGDAVDIAVWAMSALAEVFGLTDAEVAVVAAAIATANVEAARLEASITDERRCAGCGCSESRACRGGCVWATEFLCSR
jgi:hypothetical protein